MHPDMAYRIATLRVEEDTRNLRQRAARRPGLPFWRRRRRDTPAVTVNPPVELVPLPPPRQGREPAGPDRRVA